MENVSPYEYPPPGHGSTSGIPPPPGMATTYASTPVTFGPNPQVVVCPSCNTRTTTTVIAESSQKTHLIAGVLCLACCCCIPYCMESCKNKNHYCPSCGAYVGAYTN